MAESAAAYPVVALIKPLKAAGAVLGSEKPLPFHRAKALEALAYMSDQFGIVDPLVARVTKLVERRCKIASDPVAAVLILFVAVTALFASGINVEFADGPKIASILSLVSSANT